MLEMMVGNDGTGFPGLSWPYSCIRTWNQAARKQCERDPRKRREIQSRRRTLARSMGWMTTLANVAAAPPQTKGCNDLAMGLGFAGVMVAVVADVLIGG